MVRNAHHDKTGSTPRDLASELRREYPELEEVARASRGARVYAVGGAVRDLLCGRPRTDLDLVVEGDPVAIAERLGGAVADHERFLTARAQVGELAVDLARARRESYPYPGSLPEVEPASLPEDLGRRDFTVNAMALPVAGGSEPADSLIDPFEGSHDLQEGVLRALHPRSFTDDPTRVLRGARYAAGYGLRPDPGTQTMIATADLGTVSEQRRRTELERIARDRHALEALGLLSEWGVMELAAGSHELAGRVREVAERAPWAGEVDPAEATLEALADHPRAERLARTRPGSPSEAVEAARGARGEELALARALGAEWLEDYMLRWRHVGLDIDGNDLRAAGVPEGPAIGRGLSEALRAKLDGEASGRPAELAVATAAARGGDDALG